MVVPAGNEFVFAVPEALETHPQSLCFDIVDLTGAPLQRVSVEETGLQPQMLLEAADGTPLALVNTPSVYRCQEGLEICRPSGELFCNLLPDAPTTMHGRYRLPVDGVASRYELVSVSGKQLLVYQGDFRAKATTVSNPSGQLVCATERCVVDFAGRRHYQVRVGPGVDAALVLSGLLGIDKLEGPSGTSAARRDGDLSPTQSIQQVSSSPAFEESRPRTTTDSPRGGSQCGHVPSRQMVLEPAAHPQPCVHADQVLEPFRS